MRLDRRPPQQGAAGRIECRDGALVITEEDAYTSTGRVVGADRRNRDRTHCASTVKAPVTAAGPCIERMHLPVPRGEKHPPTRHLDRPRRTLRVRKGPFQFQTRQILGPQPGLRLVAAARDIAPDDGPVTFVHRDRRTRLRAAIGGRSRLLAGLATGEKGGQVSDFGVAQSFRHRAHGAAGKRPHDRIR